MSESIANDDTTCFFGFSSFSDCKIRQIRSGLLPSSPFRILFSKSFSCFTLVVTKGQLNPEPLENSRLQQFCDQPSRVQEKPYSPKANTCMSGQNTRGLVTYVSMSRNGHPDPYIPSKGDLLHRSVIKTNEIRSALKIYPARICKSGIIRVIPHA